MRVLSPTMANDQQRTTVAQGLGLSNSPSAFREDRRQLGTANGMSHGDAQSSLDEFNGSNNESELNMPADPIPYGNDVNQPTGSEFSNGTVPQANDDKNNTKGDTCWGSWKRDGHIQHTIYYILNLFCILWFFGAISAGGYAAFPFVVFTIFYALFLYEFFKSSTYKYVRCLITTEGPSEYLERMYRTPAGVFLSMECYHTFMLTTLYTDSDGNMHSQFFFSKVVTHHEVEAVNIIACQDISTRVDIPVPSTSELRPITLMKLSKSFRGDRNFDEKCTAFIARNRNRDVYYTFRVEFDIAGFSSHVLFCKTEDMPFFLSYQWCLLAHLTVIFALPYRIWITSISNKVEASICKAIETAN